MHVFFSGIGGTGIGPLSLITHQAGHDVSGSDKQDSAYIQYLAKHGITDMHIGQSYKTIAAVHAQKPIDWYVYSSAVMIEHPDSPELQFCRDHNIKMTARDELLNFILEQKHLKLIAIAGTHGKTTTTAMAIWTFKQLGLPVSYSVGGKLPFGEMGEYAANSEYFVYEADEFARNFLAFRPNIAIITGIDWDHPDIYPTRDEYEQAFRDFLDQSVQSVVWESDVAKIGSTANTVVLDDSSPDISRITLPGIVNRRDAWQVANALHSLLGTPIEQLVEILDRFPGVSRRFEQITHNLFSDYGHTPPKVRGALQMAHELAGERVVVVYEGLHNTRQHFIKDDLRTLFDDVKALYIVPSYLAREDPNLPLLSPLDLRNLLSEKAQPFTALAALDGSLKTAIQTHLQNGDLVLCLTAGGGGSLDEWLRKEF